MTDEELDKQLTALFARRRAARGESPRASLAFGARPAECPPLPLFDADRRGRDWSEAERAHLAHCPHCQKLLAVAERVGRDEPTTVVVLTAMQRSSGSVGAARGPAEPPRRIEVGAWELVPPAAELVYTDDDDRAFLLPPEVSARSYGLLEGERQPVALVLHAEPDAAGGLRPRLEVRPAPRLAALTLAVTFPTGDCRVFFVAVPASPRPATRSEPGAPLPPDAFGPDGGEWNLRIEFGSPEGPLT